ncbi:MAG: hypothetical protein RL059_1607, partial [Bacteroidota bacterium]
FYDSISVSCPIASNMGGFYTNYPLNVVNTITSISCQVNKNNSPFSNPTVYTNNALPLSKTTTINGDSGQGQSYSYSFNQYFCNANISFQPTYENVSNTYTVIFSIIGVGTYEFNTTVSSYAGYNL